MKLEAKEGFYEISLEEMQDIDGGDILSDLANGYTLYLFIKEAFLLGFNAGKEAARGLKDWMSDTELEPMVVIPEPI